MDLHALTLALQLDGLDAEFVEAEAGTGHVDVSVFVDGFDDPLTIQVAPVELTDRPIGDLEMVQLFAAAPRPLDDVELADVLLALPEVNARMPLGAFGVIGEPPVVYLRHVMLLPQGDVAHRLVTEGVWLTSFALDLNLEDLLDL